MIFDKLTNCNSRDLCLRVSLYFWGASQLEIFNLFSKTKFDEAKHAFETMQSYCRLRQTLGHRKHPNYLWSNSGSENPNENTILKRPTKWIYDHFLKFLGIDPYKGLNCDQYRAYALSVYQTKDVSAALKVIFGLVLRLGFLPSLTEHILFKPQSMVLFLKLLRERHSVLWTPFYLISKLAFLISMKRNLKIPIEEDTSNKISLLPTMKILRLSMPRPAYEKEVYETYFHGKEEGGVLIKEILLKALG